MRLGGFFCLCLAFAGPISTAAEPGQQKPFQIRVVDPATGRGVPLVELRTVHGVRFYTDSHGVAAIDEPGLFGQRVYFYVESHGYEFPQDGFGYRGKALFVEPGGTATLKIQRRNLAERLYRVTGAGIYRDSLLTGQAAPLREPVLNGQVLGSDSVMNAVFRGKLYWFWGDTNRPSYPLGNFHVPGAVSDLPERGGLKPEIGVELSYFLDTNGFAKETCKMAGDGPTWIDGLTVLRDASGRERMFAAYAKIKPPLTAYRRGLAEWSDEENRFEHRLDFNEDAPLRPAGHTFQREENGRRYVYFCTPFPLTRVPATPEAFSDSSQYEAFTCLEEGSRFENPQLDRDATGALRYSWKKNAPAVNMDQQAKLLQQNLAKKSELLLQLRDRDSGKSILAHGGSVYWNEFRRRWVMIVVELFGSSPLGEVWCAEADAPEGPWAYATKIVTHDNYSFYNPKQHPMFDQDGGRVIYFEGTYTHTFSKNSNPTPRYDYNQIMYRLDLSDPRAALPVAIYREGGNAMDRFVNHLPNGSTFEWNRIAFFALDRPGENTVSVYSASGPDGHSRLILSRPEEAKDAAPHFFAIPADMAEPPATVVPLYEFVHAKSGRRAYTTDEGWKRDGFERSPAPLCRVWPNPAHSAQN